MNMKYKLLLLLFSLILTSCSTDDYILNSKISAEIIQTKELDLSKYNDFNWDSLIIIGPYSNVEKTALANNLDLSYVSKNIEHADDINLIVFLKARKAVKSCELKRMYGNFDGIYGQVIPKKKANFYLTGDIFPKDPAKLHLK